MRRWAATCWLLLLLLAASAARADDPKRAVPDYDGRAEGTSAGEVLLWIPRVILSPLYLVSEFVIRRPLGFLISAAERAKLPEAIYDLFIFGPNNSAGLLPIAFVDFGFYPSFGLYYFQNDAFVKGHDLRIRGSTFGEHWLAGAWSDTFHVDPLVDVVFTASGIRRPDYAFFGLGPDALHRDRSRYGGSKLDANLRLEIKLSDRSRFISGVGVRRVHFHQGGFSNDPLLVESVRAGRFPTPPGYPEGYSGIYNHASLAIDTRSARPASQSGVRFEARAEHMSQLSDGPGFIRYGGGLAGFLDMGEQNRVVSLAFTASFADPLRAGAEIPFTELAAVGGGETMRGFQPGRLYGRSATTATLRYRWPIWVWLDGSLQFAVGNVFGAHLENFALKLLRLSAAIGFESVGARDSSMEFLFGFGSETFEHGTQVNSFRLIVGTNHGF